MKELYKFIKSGASSAFAGFIYIGGGYALDKYLPPNISTLIALILGELVDFLFQTTIFYNLKKITHTHLIKYIFVEFLIIGVNAVLAMLLINNKHKLIKYLPRSLRKDYNTVARTIAGQITFLVISYPLRRYFVFG